MGQGTPSKRHQRDSAPVNLLALDTSTARALLAVRRSDGRGFSASTDPAARHGRSLLPQVRSLLEEAQLRTADLDQIAVGIGPGSFTGLRIGLTAAKVLAYAGGLPLLPFDSLDLYAHAAPEGVSLLAVIAEAQRGELYLARFRPGDVGSPPVRLGPTEVVGRNELDRLPRGTHLAGPALDRPKTVWPGHLHLVPAPANEPDPRLLLELADRASAVTDFWDLEPAYLRRSAAEEKAAAAASR